MTLPHSCSAGDSFPSWLPPAPNVRSTHTALLSNLCPKRALKSDLQRLNLKAELKLIRRFKKLRSKYDVVILDDRGYVQQSQE